MSPVIREIGFNPPFRPPHGIPGPLGGHDTRPEIIHPERLADGAGIGMTTVGTITQPPPANFLIFRLAARAALVTFHPPSDETATNRTNPNASDNPGFIQQDHHVCGGPGLYCEESEFLWL